MAEDSNESGSFEQALDELDRIVKQLEAGDLPLEQSLELFERGVKLSRLCQKRLEDAERRVEVLVRGEGGTHHAIPFEEPEE